MMPTNVYSQGISRPNTGTPYRLLMIVAEHAEHEACFVAE